MRNCMVPFNLSKGTLDLATLELAFDVELFPTSHRTPSSYCEYPSGWLDFTRWRVLFTSCSRAAINQPMRTGYLSAIRWFTSSFEHLPGSRPVGAVPKKTPQTGAMRIPAVTMFTKLLRFILVFNCPLSTCKLINCGLQESSKAPGAFSVSYSFYMDSDH